jgi:light-harvesting protein B-800-850 alpha chain
MNQGRIWCVVHPTVGLPLLIGSAAVTSLIVHYAILSHTTWMSKYWEGGVKKAAMATDGPAVGAAQTAPAFTVSVAPVQATDGSNQTSFVVTVTPTAGAAAPAITVGDASAGPPLAAAPAN